MFLAVSSFWLPLKFAVLLSMNECSTIAFCPYNVKASLKDRTPRKNTIRMKSSEPGGHGSEFFSPKVVEDFKTPTRRRMFASAVHTAAVLSSLRLDSAGAFDSAYPLELQGPSETESFIDSRTRSVEKIRRKEAKRASNVLVASPLLSSIVWGSALWFLSGSRSNPIATPLANSLYNATQETWLQDRNDELFAGLPWEFLIILSIVFLALGFGTNLLISTIAEGDRVISLQLAGVSLIAGCSLELGRIASGDKKQTRQESDRSVQLKAEFITFADERLLPGGNCHRNEVVRAFRRFYAKYRQADSAEYPLSDLEIEQLLREYCRPRGLGMSSAGFYSGLQINQDSDVFAKAS